MLTIPNIIRRRPMGTSSGDAGAVAAELSDAAAARRRTDRPILDDLPVLELEGAYFHQIPVPGSLNALTIPAGMSAWYGLRRIQIGRDGAPELAFAGAHLELLSCDVDGAGVSGQVSAAGGAGTALPWGDALGRSAALVVGTRLPMTVGQWTPAAADIPGIQMAVSTAAPERTRISPEHPARYLIVQQFPPGKWSQSPPGWVCQRYTTLGGIHVLPAGTTLDVALVVAGAQVNALAENRVVCGYGLARLMMLNLNVMGQQFSA